MGHNHKAFGIVVCDIRTSVLARDGVSDGDLEMGLEITQDQFSLMLVHLGDEGLADRLGCFLWAWHRPQPGSPWSVWG